MKTWDENGEFESSDLGETPRWAFLCNWTFVTRELRKLGWKVVPQGDEIRVWEHELKFPEKVAAKLMRVGPFPRPLP